jgi:hypothetical protein
MSLLIRFRPAGRHRVNPQLITNNVYLARSQFINKKIFFKKIKVKLAAAKIGKSESRKELRKIIEIRIRQRLNYGRIGATLGIKQTKVNHRQKKNNVEPKILSNYNAV